MKTRIIYTKFWSDDYISSLTSLEKLVFLFYLTNDKVNIIHCYECLDKYTLLDTGVSTEVLQKCKRKFETDGKIHFCKSYVKLVNADKYEKYKGEDNDKAKKTLIGLMSDEIRAWYNTPVTPLSTGVYTPPINHKSYIINNKEILTKYSSIDCITEEFLQTLQSQFKDKDVNKEFEKMKDWLLSKGKKQKNYQAFFRYWLRNAYSSTQTSMSEALGYKILKRV